MGYIYILLSALFFCLMTIFVKIAGQHMQTIQIVFMRGVITLIFSYILIKRNNVYLWGNNKKILAIRGFVGTVALFLVFESIQRFSLPEATVIQYLYPIFTALLASILISENIGKVLYLAIPLGFIGVYIILDLQFVYHDSAFHTTDLTIAIIGSFLTGLAYVMVRMASNLKESPYVIMFYFPLFTVPLSFVLTYNVWSRPTIDILSLIHI